MLRNTELLSPEPLTPLPPLARSLRHSRKAHALAACQCRTLTLWPCQLKGGCQWAKCLMGPRQKKSKKKASTTEPVIAWNHSPNSETPYSAATFHSSTCLLPMWQLSRFLPLLAVSALTFVSSTALLPCCPAADPSSLSRLLLLWADPQPPHPLHPNFLSTYQSLQPCSRCQACPTLSTEQG